MNARLHSKLVSLILPLAFLLCIDVTAQQPNWSATGSLSVARSLHTATLLANGKVLVVGGISVINPCCTNTGVAELYDPATGQWSATGAPSTPRSNHIAVRLNNGKVLIATGNGSPFSNIVTSSEIYDPATGTWSPAANVNTARQSPRAALLADGRVLLTGGLISVSGTAVFTTSTEIYDPAANTWTPVAAMNTGRVLHSVTLLPDGKVLVAGGTSANFVPILQNTAELYDPAANRWTVTGELKTPRITHSAAILSNGKALISGGSNNGVDIIDGAELYDPATGQWTATGAMTIPRSLHALTLMPNGRVLATGGSSSNFGGLQKSSELYNPASGTWTNLVDFNAGRQNHTATLLANGKVLIAGGSGATQLTSAEILDSGIPVAVFANVSAASFRSGELAAESIVAAFGSNLSPGIFRADDIPLPAILGGVTANIRDNAGIERPAPLFFVGSGQINYQVPPGSAGGLAYVSIINNGNVAATGLINIASIAPGLFSANANGQGVAAAVALRVGSNGSQTYELIARFDSGLSRFVTEPIDLGPDSEQLFLVLYGTGIRFRSALSNVTATIGGENSEVSFADPAPGFVGIEQINLRIPRSLIGRGEVDVIVTVDGIASNVVRIAIR